MGLRLASTAGELRLQGRNVRVLRRSKGTETRQL
jgi:hypothetical protein